MSKKTVSPARKTTKVNVPTDQGMTEEGQDLYYVVYVDSYIDNETILPRGVYKASRRIERLDNSQPRFVRSFNGMIPDKIVHEIADTLRVKILDEDNNYRETEDILSEIVTVI